MRKFGYAATDYIIIAAVILAAVVPFLFLTAGPARETAEKDITDAVETVKVAAESLTRLAPDSADRVAVVIPRGISGNPIIGPDGTLRLNVGGREQVFHFRNVEGRFPINPGRQFVYLRNVRGKIVISPGTMCGDGIVEGSEQCEPSILIPGACPSGSICRNDCRCSCSNPPGCSGQYEGQICNTEGYCVPCTNDAQCNQAMGERCIAGRCRVPPVPPRDCRFPGGECTAGYHCQLSANRWQCVPLPPPCSPPCVLGESCVGSPPGCVPTCSLSPCPVPGQTCNPDPTSGTYGQCVECSNNAPCEYPFKVCDLQTNSPTHLLCRPCKLADLPIMCDADRSGRSTGYTCRATDINGDNGVCGECDDNDDCLYPDRVCDPVDHRCKICYWANQCNNGDMCINGQCRTTGSPGPGYGCGTEPDGIPGRAGQPPAGTPPERVACDPHSCAGGKICVRRGSGCRCVSFARWWQLPTSPVPPQGRPDPGNPGGQQGGPPVPSGGTTPASGCAFNPYATMSPGNPNSLCTSGCASPSEPQCTLIGPSECACRGTGSANYFTVLASYLASQGLPAPEEEEITWEFLRYGPPPGGSTGD